MNQQDMLRKSMRDAQIAFDQMATELGVSQQALDGWLLPEDSSGFSRMPESAMRLLSSRFGVRRSSDYSLPYDWSDPAMRDDALILSVLRRARFADVVRLCLDFGLDTVASHLPCVLAATPPVEQHVLSRILERMLGSIKIAFSE